VDTGDYDDEHVNIEYSVSVPFSEHFEDDRRPEEMKKEPIKLDCDRSTFAISMPGYFPDYFGLSIFTMPIHSALSTLSSWTWAELDLSYLFVLPKREEMTFSRSALRQLRSNTVVKYTSSLEDNHKKISYVASSIGFINYDSADVLSQNPILAAGDVASLLLERDFEKRKQMGFISGTTLGVPPGWN
jgi:hypothetical protein